MVPIFVNHSGYGFGHYIVQGPVPVPVPVLFVAATKKGDNRNDDVGQWARQSKQLRYAGIYLQVRLVH